MEQIKINLINLTSDTIIRKIRAFVNSQHVISLDLLVRTKNQETPVQNNKIQNQIVNHTNFIKDRGMQKAKKHYIQGNYDSAIQIYKGIFNKLNKSKENGGKQPIQGDWERKISNVTFQLANCYYHQRQFQKSIEFYKKEFEGENLKHKAMRRSNLATIYLQLQQYQLSLKYYGQAMTIYKQCQFEEVDLSNTFHNIGRIYLQEKMFGNAVQFFEMAVRERKIKSPSSELPLFQSIFKLGIAYRCDCKHEESIKNFEYALSFAERGVGELGGVLKELALTYEGLQKWEEALNIYEKLIQKRNISTEEKAYFYEKAGNILYQNYSCIEGRKVFKQAQKLYRQIGNIEKAKLIRNNFFKN